MRPPAPLIANFVGIAPLLQHAHVHARAVQPLTLLGIRAGASRARHVRLRRTARARACTRALLAAFPRAHTATAHSAHAHAHALPHTLAPPARSPATCPRIHLPLLSNHEAAGHRK
jgi:hypothetical protein